MGCLKFTCMGSWQYIVHWLFRCSFLPPHTLLKMWLYWEPTAAGFVIWQGMYLTCAWGRASCCSCRAAWGLSPAVRSVCSSGDAEGGGDPAPRTTTTAGLQGEHNDRFMIPRVHNWSALGTYVLSDACLWLYGCKWSHRMSLITVLKFSFNKHNYRCLTVAAWCYC